ncbi:hypothetical protein [Viridibacterium curvum]|uniref:Extracellular solute-binding protein n=1 Tax=Viridibacterium curvum TaxID=1101404 RepID=A0ABP9QPZ9_9RHOO
MRKILGPLLAMIVGGAVLVGIWFSAQEQRGDSANSLTVVRGLIGSEKEGFYRDPRVVDAFAKLGLRLEVLKSGSREMADHPDLKQFDFGHPAGSPAAQRLKEVSKAKQLFNPFYTPLAVASWQKLVPLLQGNGLVEQRDGVLYLTGLPRLLKMTADGKRWRELRDNKAYDSGRVVFIASTDVRKSNSAAMYLALASYLLNGNDVVQSDEAVQKVMPTASQLFLRQGFLEASSAGPFEDYVSMGMGKAPLVMVYESQFIEYQSRLPQPNAEMVLLYPQPTVLTKHVLVPFTEAGARVGEALDRDPELQKLAAEYGFRSASPQHFVEFLKQKKLSAPSVLDDVIDPPSYAMLERMIDVVAAQMK